MISWVELDSPLLMWIFLLLRLDQGQNLVKRGRSEYFWLLQLGQKELKSFYWICKAGGAPVEFWGSNNNFFHLAHLNFPPSTYHFLKTNSSTFCILPSKGCLCVFKKYCQKNRVYLCESVHLMWRGKILSEEKCCCDIFKRNIVKNFGETFRLGSWRN